MKWHVSFSRFAVVGLISNFVGYLLYLLFTDVGIEPKVAMTLLYVISVVQTFYINRGWAFGHAGKASFAFVRYITAYGIGYVLNLAILMTLVDHWGWSHQLVQGAAILLVAIFNFFAQKLWVFAPVSGKNEL